MKVTIKIKRTVVFVEEFHEVEFAFEELLDHEGLTRFEYNEDPEGYVESYVSEMFEDLIDNHSCPPDVSEREDGSDEIEFEEVWR